MKGNINNLSRQAWKLIGKTFSIIGIVYTVTTLAKWYYISRGIDYDPMGKIEEDALKYFRIQQVEKMIKKRR